MFFRLRLEKLTSSNLAFASPGWLGHLLPHLTLYLWWLYGSAQNLASHFPLSNLLFPVFCILLNRKCSLSVAQANNLEPPKPILLLSYLLTLQFILHAAIISSCSSTQNLLRCPYSDPQAQCDSFLSPLLHLWLCVILLLSCSALTILTSL